MQHYVWNTFDKISTFEILLRRILRWELMAKDGASWLVSLGNYYDEIDLRVRKEKNAGLYSSNSSDLSYLSLNELMRIMFNDHWSMCFKNVFYDDKGLYRELVNNVIPLRNKLAHFRVIDQFDMHNLRTLHEAELIIQKYYNDSSKMEFYLASDPEWVEEMIDDEIINNTKSCLKKHSLEHLFDDFSKLDGIRRLGYWPGMGLYKNHFFIELHCEKDSYNLDFNDWINKNKYSVTLITKTKIKIRIFWPVIMGREVINKGISSLLKYIYTSQEKKIFENSEFYELNEYIVFQNSENKYGVAF
jgi:hypothetical protein